MTKLDALMAVLTVLAIALKVAGVINFHWLIVLLPVWGWAAVRPLVADRHERRLEN